MKSTITFRMLEGCRLLQEGDEIMRYGDPELTSTPCPACGCADVFTAVAPLGTREMSLYPACCHCGRERDDLTGFYIDPPTQPRLDW